MKKLAWILGAASLLLVGCESYSEPTTTTVDNAPPASGAVTAVSTLSIVAPKSFVRGTNPQVAATVIDDSGRPLDVTRQVTWVSSNFLVATVADGRLWGVGPGTATVRATIGEQTASFDVTVVEKSVVSLSIMADAEYAAPDQTRTWSARASYNDGSTADVTADAEWDSSDEAIATLDAPGVVHAQALGMATISVSFAGQKASAPFLVQ